MKTIGITLGDQAGIGPEIVKKALAADCWKSDYEFRVIGDPIEVLPGQPNLESAKAAYAALTESVSLLRRGDIDAVATAPVSKEWLHKVGFSYPGQTEFFADQLDCENFAMCLSGKHLTVALVTIHIPLKEVSKSLSHAEIVRIGQLLYAFCQKRSIQQPRIAVCGLNPHAGEHGAFGQEDLEIIAPAIKELNTLHSGFSGPHSADTIFRPAADGHYDAVLCMYHDQGLIPLKLLDFDTGVNTTLGLTRPRTSPDHGTAYNIAGTGQADPSSMIHAIQLACELC